MKNKSESNVAEPKKRGRKPKIHANHIPDDQTKTWVKNPPQNEQPKHRGRKPKEITKAIEEPKKQRGRPRKNIVDAPIMKKVRKQRENKERIVFMALQFQEMEVLNPIILKTPKGFRVSGHSSDGKPLSSFISKEVAEKAVNNGSAKKGW